MYSSEFVRPILTVPQYDNGDFSLRTYVFADATGATHFGFPRNAGLWAITGSDGRIMLDPYLERYPFTRRLAQTAFLNYESTGNPIHLGEIVSLITNEM